MKTLFLFVYIFSVCLSGLYAGNHQVTNHSDSVTSPAPGSLRQAMLDAFLLDNDSIITITFDDDLGNIRLVDHLPVLSNDQSPDVMITVDGGIGNTIDGGGTYQAFFVTPTYNDGLFVTGNINATIRNLSFNNCSIRGSEGQDGDGGGMGAGGAIFVDNNAYVIGESLTFNGCSAIGGDSYPNDSTHISRGEDRGVAGFGGGRGRSFSGVDGAGMNQSGGGGAGLGGAVFYRNSGLLTLSNCTFNNCFVTEGRSINDGTNGSALGTDIFIQGSSTLTTTGDVIIGGTIHSDGAWEKRGTGTLYLFSTNSFIGPTNLTEGTFALRANEALGTSPLLMQNSTALDLGKGVRISNDIAFRGAHVITVGSGRGLLSGILSDSGSFTKKGLGALVLTGNSSAFTGDVIVLKGELKVDGILGASVAIDSNGQLSGAGRVGAINCSGLLSPGNSLGTLSCGPASLMSGSIYAVEVNPTQASLLNVTGTILLGGTLKITQDPGSYPSLNRYIILQTTEGIRGSFESIIIHSLPGFTFRLENDGYNLSLIYELLPAILPEPPLPPIPPLPPTHLQGKQITKRFLTQTNMTNVIKWAAPANGSVPAFYKVYRNHLSRLIGIVPANKPLRFKDRHRRPHVTDTYYIVSVDEKKMVSLPAKIIIKPQGKS